MTIILTRRAMCTAIGAGVLLSGCTINRVASSTEVTLNVAKVNAYIQAGFNAAESVISVVAMVPSLSLYGAALDTSLRLLRVAAADFNDATKGFITVRYDSEDIKGSIDTIVTLLDEIAQTILKVAASEFGLDARTKTSLSLIQSALATVLSLFSASLIKGSATSTTMAYQEHVALKTLNG